MAQQTKVVVLFANYGPYHLARVNSFHELCTKYDIQCVAIELARSEATYAWVAAVEKLPYPFISVLPDHQLEQVSSSQVIKRLFAVLNRVNPSVLAIAGYALPAMLAAKAWATIHHKPTVLFSASKEDDASREQWKESVKGWLVNQYDAALVGGAPQKRYLEKLGMPSDHIFLGYNVVGNDAFAPENIRGLPRPISRPYFMAVNRFVPRKNLLALISAYAAYRQKAIAQPWDLVLCGEGSLRPQLEEKIREYGLEDVVHLPGFLQQNELLPYLAHAGCFVHPSLQEQWGLVVNEAMAAGLPVIVSNCCGCYEDLVIEGVNGFGFDPEDTAALTHCLIQVSSDDLDRTAMGQAGLRHIQKFSPAYFAEGLYHAVTCASRSHQCRS
jgi:1,2-diacylglycerol 3-alpha-glucosyltransferase